MEITNITLCPNQDYLLGCDKEGFLYIWAFKEILTAFLKSNYDGIGCFRHFCKIKIANEEIKQLKILGVDSFLISCGAKEILFYDWKTIIQIIEERKNLNIDNCEDNITSQFQFNIVADQNNKEYSCFAFSSDNSTLIIGSHELEIFHIPSSKDLGVLKSQHLEMKDKKLKYTSLLIRNSSQLIAGTEQGIIQIWDLKNNSLITTLKEDNEEVFSKVNFLSFEDASCNWLLCAHDDYITKWNLCIHSLTFVIETNVKPICLVSSRDYFLSGHENENICKWSFDGTFLGENPTTIKAVSSISLIQDLNKSLIISAGCGPFVDIFFNNYRIFSFIAQ